MKKNIYVMYTIALLQGMVFYGPVATLYRQAQGVSVFEITLIESISMILCILLEIPWGVIADKIGYKRTMIFCCGLYFFSKAVFFMATGFWWFLMERIMLSIVISGLSGIDTSILFLSCEKGNSQKTFGIYNSLCTAGLLIAALVYSVFIGENFKLAALLTVLSYGIAAAVSLILTEVKPKGSRTFSKSDFKEILVSTFKNRQFVLFLISVAFLSETHQTITVFLNQIKYEKNGLSSSAIGYIYIFITLVGLCGAYSKKFTNKYGAKNAGMLLYGASFVSCIVLYFTENAWISVSAITVLRISNSLFWPLQTELQNEQILTDNRATALSVNAMILDIVAAGTNLVFGTLSKISINAAFLFGAILCSFGLMLFLRWYYSRKIA